MPSDSNFSHAVEHGIAALFIQFVAACSRAQPPPDGDMPAELMGSLKAAVAPALRQWLAEQSPKIEVGSRWRLRGPVERFPHFQFEAGEEGTVTKYEPGNLVALKMDRHDPGADEWDNEIVWTLEDDYPEHISETWAFVSIAQPVEPEEMDYHSRCEYAYRNTLVALRRAGLHAEFIDTGGSCKAILVTGVGDRTFDRGVHMLLTAAGPLGEERDPEYEWEVGLYREVAEYGTVDTAMLTTIPALKDRPEDDAELAEWLGNVAEVIR